MREAVIVYQLTLLTEFYWTATGPAGPRQDGHRDSLSGSERCCRAGWQTAAGRPTHVR